jgi:hypothetical protein
MSDGPIFLRAFCAGTAFATILLVGCGEPVSPRSGAVVDSTAGAPGPTVATASSISELPPSTDVASKIAPSTTLSLDDPNRFVVRSNFYEPEADAPFPAVQFLARNSRGIVTQDLVYLVTAGQGGTDKSSPATFFIEVLKANTTESLSQKFMVVAECVGFASLTPGDVTDPSQVPFSCEADGRQGILDLQTMSYQLKPAG